MRTYRLYLHHLRQDSLVLRVRPSLERQVRVLRISFRRVHRTIVADSRLQWIEARRRGIVSPAVVRIHLARVIRVRAHVDRLRPLVLPSITVFRVVPE